MSTQEHRAFWIVAGLLAVAAGSLAVWIPTTLETGTDQRPLLLCIALVGLNAISYAAWFSRYNILAHTQLVFGVVAYVIPIVILNQLDGLTSKALDIYYKTTVWGFLACLIGVLLGAAISSPTRAERLRARWTFDPDAIARLDRRAKWIVGGSVALLTACFLVMGFVPALAADPFAAKFFRGAYQAAYAPVATPYRLATTLIALFLPLTAVFAWKRRNLTWVALLGASVLLLLLALLREPAITGLLLFIGIYFAGKGRGLPIVFALLVGTYVAGGAFYYILGQLGVGEFAYAFQKTTLLGSVSAGVPDVQDQVQFLRAWTMYPVSPEGRTFWGGLIPGNYEWNPSVWSIQVVNPGVPLSDLNSGGLRLPSPIWAYVNFGWAGVVLVCGLQGIIIGYLARLASRLIEGQRLEAAMCWTIIYAAIVEVFAQFYVLSYLSVLALVVLYVFFRPARTDRLTRVAAKNAKVRTRRERRGVDQLGSALGTNPTEAGGQRRR